MMTSVSTSKVSVVMLEGIEKEFTLNFLSNPNKLGAPTFLFNLLFIISLKVNLNLQRD